MKKRIMLIMVGLLCCSSLAACGKKEEPKQDAASEAEAKEPTDLTGTWKSEDKDGSYQEATITADSIEINWVSPDSTSLYWAGTYTAPDSAVDEYSWTSENDHEKTDMALLASSDDTKEFTYKDGVISYSASALGTTTTVELSRE